MRFRTSLNLETLLSFNIHNSNATYLLICVEKVTQGEEISPKTGFAVFSVKIRPVSPERSIIQIW